VTCSSKAVISSLTGVNRPVRKRFSIGMAVVECVHLYSCYFLDALQLSRYFLFLSGLAAADRSETDQQLQPIATTS
jgi:hypothetical protein